MEIRMMNYDLQLLNSIQASPDSVFQDGNQRSVYAICDIHETDGDYLVSFLPSKGDGGEPITFDFIGRHLFISGEGNPNFAVDVQARTQPIEAHYNEGLLQLRLPKSACTEL
jgi:hypothetical protein